MSNLSATAIVLRETEKASESFPLYCTMDFNGPMTGDLGLVTLRSAPSLWPPLGDIGRVEGHHENAG